MKLHNVVFPQPESTAGPVPPKLWDISLVDGVVKLIEPASDADAGSNTQDSDIANHLLLPSLCHPHLHLDKAYLLTSSGCCRDSSDEPNYSDLLPQTGSFAEALRTTAIAKARFTAADLRRRGLQLLATSYTQGVTSARVFVEVDAQAVGQGTVAVAVARELKELFGKSGRLDLQVCAFAQEVLFTGEAGTANRAAMEAVLETNRKEGDDRDATIAVLGVTPYVEATREQSLQNMDWAVTTALEYGLHLDLHLDYNLKEYDGSSAQAPNEPLIFALLEALVRHKWTERAVYGRKEGKRTKTRTVVVGHATQLTCLPRAQLARLANIIQKYQLPVYFVGLPTSDLYMMGRQSPVTPEETPLQKLGALRGTLPVPTLIREFGLRACLGVNNVGNAFTPYGTGDPLHLACWCVGLYHAGTGPDARLLYGSISWRAWEAIGMGSDSDNMVDWGKSIDRPEEQLLGKKFGSVLVIANRRYIELPLLSQPAGLTAKETALNRILARPRLGFRDVVWDPPDISLRKVV
ncbi:hypothetical protein SEUCBS140593_007345 [Sporothrix eucalyptigena]|uniref:Zinc metallopeptidase n=1 Tax=Sporothrix eucalyptigena TaxID=1812306 RepID=A0ABP0CF70_9PEZI